jgi:hypothetical protein
MKPFNNIFKLISVVVVIYFGFLMTVLFFVPDWGTSGTLGDTFGILNTLFSGAALVGVSYTLYLQAQTNELQRKDYARNIQPLLTIEPKKEKRGSTFILIVTNIGNGTALNINFPPAKLSPELSLEYKLEEIISLTPGQNKDIEVKAFDQNEEADSIWTAHLNPKYANRTIKLEVTYCDIEFNRMKQEFNLGLGEKKVAQVQHIDKQSK